MTVDLSSCRLEPYAHQRTGIEALFRRDDPATGRVIGGAFLLADEMGAGKTKQVIDAGQALWKADVIHRVIIVAPASVLSVWRDPELGELAKHLWPDVPSRVFEYRAKIASWDFGPEGDRRLKWIVTNYDFVRVPARLAFLLGVADKKTWLVLDESSAVKNYKSQQSRACQRLRAKCGRVTLLNGTPITQDPVDMFGQGLVMDKRILDCNYWQFRARYAILGGWRQKQIVGWRDLPDLQRRFAPYVLRRLKKDCIDLPEKLPPVAIDVPMSERTWGVYRSMRDDMVAWLTESAVSVAMQAVVKAVRLSQVTSGFLGGVTEEPGEPGLDFDGESAARPVAPGPVREIGREKLDAFMAWHAERLAEDPGFKCLVGCRFRAEVERLAAALASGGATAVGVIWGGQDREERAASIRLLDPRTMPAGPAVVAATTGSGSLGLNLAGATTVAHVSNDCNLKTRLQFDDRVHRPGQRHVVSYFDFVAVGPQGQRTIDHAILRALRDKESLATWTTAAWLAALRD